MLLFPRISPLCTGWCICKLSLYFRISNIAIAVIRGWLIIVQSAIADLGETWSFVVCHCGVSLDEACALVLHA